MKRELTLGVGLIFLLARVAFAESNYPIDLKEARCVEADSSTAGMVNCAKQAEVEWDQELNKYYGLLIKALNKAQADKLRQAQRAWLEYREKEFENISAFFSIKEGTMWIPIRSAHYLDVVKQRALELKGYYDLLHSE